MTDTPTPRRPRFSLRTLLTLTAWLAMGMTIFLQWRELAPLRAEVKKLRDETGKLWVEDETKVYAIQVESYESNVWIWRVWLPPGRKYRLHHVAGLVPRLGELPVEGSVSVMQGGGERVFCHRLRKDQETDKYQSMLTMAGDSWRQSLGPKECEWWDSNAGFSTEGVFRSQKAYASDQPVILLRLKTGTGGPVKMTETTPGFLIWLEPIK